MTSIFSVLFFLIGLVIPVLAIIGLVSLFTKKGTDGKRKFGDGYFYFMAFVALMVLYWGVSDLWRIIFEKWWVGGVSPSTGYYGYGASASNSYEQWLRGLSLRISSILVSLPIWFFHWHKATSRPKEEMDEAGKKAYSFVVVLFTSLFSIGMLIGAAYLGINALLGITLSTAEKKSLAFLLPYSIGALTLWLTHWRVWHAGRGKEEIVKSDEEIK